MGSKDCQAAAQNLLLDEIGRLLDGLASQVVASSEAERMAVMAAVHDHVKRFESNVETNTSKVLSENQSKKPSTPTTAAALSPTSVTLESAPSVEVGQSDVNSPDAQLEASLREKTLSTPWEPCTGSTTSTSANAASSNGYNPSSSTDLQPKVEVAPPKMEAHACSESESGGDRGLVTGSWAKLSELETPSDLNGQTCRLLSYSRGRWKVRVPSSGKSLKVFPTNLTTTSAPSPRVKIRGACDEAGKKLLSKLQKEVNGLLEKQPSPGSSSADGAQRIFSAVTASKIFALEVFEQRPFVIECGDAIAHMWTREDQFELLLPDTNEDPCTTPRTANLELSSHCRFTNDDIAKSKIHSFCVAEDSTKEGQLTINEAKRRLESATWVFSGSETCVKPIGALCKGLTCAFEIPFVTCNVYMSRLDQNVTAPLHTDRMDSFIFQTEGSKRWRVFDASDQLPPWPILDAGCSDRGKNGDVLYVEEVGPCLLDECLRPGDVLYLPRGLPHATSTFNTAELHRKNGIVPALSSTSLTVSLLLESVKLTYDKFLRCAAGIQEGGGKIGVRCIGAETVLKSTSICKPLRAVLPIGFLANPVLNQSRKGSDLFDVDDVRQWSEAVAITAGKIVDNTVLAEVPSLSGPSSQALFREIAATIFSRVKDCREFFWNNVLADGCNTIGKPPKQQLSEGEKYVAGYQFYPDTGRIYVDPPSIVSKDAFRQI